MLGILPLAWEQRSRVLLFFGLVAFISLYAFSAAQVEDGLVLAALFYCACLYLSFGRLVGRSAFSESAPLFEIVGFAVYMILLYALSFQQVGREVINLNLEGFSEWGYMMGPLLSAGFVWIALLATRAWQRADALRRWETGLILLSMLLVLVVQFAVSREHVGAVALVFNVVFLAHCVILIVRGTGRLDWKRVSLGCVLFAALVFARFTDLFDSLLMRSLFFLALGAGLFLIGNFYTRRKKLQDAGHA